MSSPISIAPTQRIDIYTGFLHVLLSTILTLFTAPFRGKDTLPSYRKHVLHHALRKMMSRLSVAQFQYFDRNTSTDIVYAQFSKTQGFKSQSVDLADGTKAHWIGRKDAKRVVLWFPGGGFVLPASRFHFQLAAECGRILNGVGRDVAVLVVSTNLAPGRQYPHQLQQAVLALNYLLQDTNREVSSIALAGDSTGANLVLAILSHILHPLPSIPPIAISGPFAGALLSSPTTSFDKTYPSVTQNRHRDYIGPNCLPDWGDSYLGAAQKTEYTDPASAAAEWWLGLGSVVNRVLVISGEWELFRDAVKVWCERVQEHNDMIDTVEVPEAFHDQVLMDMILKSKVPSKASEAMRSWILKHLWA